MTLTPSRMALSTGVALDVWSGGPAEGPAVILLHGFPESHRTWDAVAADLARDHRVIAPDQRGSARSDKPPDVADYAPDRIVGDLLAMADALGIARFTLVGHDWGGAIAWMAALQHPDRVARLAILNAPHPLVFQRSLFDDPAQRAASQYITAFRNPGIEDHVGRVGLSQFYDTSFAAHAEPAKAAARKADYLDEWGQPGALTGMLNWYRASAVVVPAPDETPARPGFLDAAFPPVIQPTLAVWGMRDTALLPCQLDGLDALVSDLTVVRVADAGHFVTWEAPDAVIAAFRDWEAGLTNRINPV